MYSKQHSKRNPVCATPQKGILIGYILSAQTPPRLGNPPKKNPICAPPTYLHNPTPSTIQPPPNLPTSSSPPLASDFFFHQVANQSSHSSIITYLPHYSPYWLQSLFSEPSINWFTSRIPRGRLGTICWINIKAFSFVHPFNLYSLPIYSTAHLYLFDFAKFPNFISRSLGSTTSKIIQDYHYLLKASTSWLWVKRCISTMMSSEIAYFDLKFGKQHIIVFNFSTHPFLQVSKGNQNSLYTVFYRTTIHLRTHMNLSLCLNLEENWYLSWNHCKILVSSNSESKQNCQRNEDN